MRPRHRPPPWWVRHRIAAATSAGAVLVTMVVGLAAAVAPSPHVDQPQTVTAQPTSAHASGTKPWPTVAVPTIGATGAWDPDPTTAAAPTIDRPATPTSCSRCGDRTPPEPTSEPPPAPTSAGEQAAAEDPQPAAVAELLALVNADRAADGCPPVTLHPSLVDQSQAHAERQAAEGSMFHSGGVTGFDTWGENVAYGYDTAAAVHQGWMSSPGHRENILNCAFTVMGAGAADSPDGVRYWTEQFAA